MHPIDSHLPLIPAELFGSTSRIVTESEREPVEDCDDRELRDIFRRSHHTPLGDDGESDGVVPHRSLLYRSPPTQPALPSLLRMVRRRSPEPDSELDIVRARDAAPIELESRESDPVSPAEDTTSPFSGWPAPSPSILERFILEREAASSPYSRRRDLSLSEPSPDVDRQKRMRADEEEEADISNAGEAIKKIWARPKFYKNIDPCNPIKRDPLVIRAALQSSPDLFFDIPFDLQTDSVLQKIAFLSAKKRRQEDICQRLIVSCGVRGNRCLCEFEHLVSDITWERSDAVQNFFREQSTACEDREVLLAFLCVGENISRYIGPAIRRDKSFLILACEMGLPSLQYVDPTLQHDKELIFALVRRFPQELSHAASMFQEDRPFLLDVARQNGMVLAYVSEPFRNDHELVCLALHQNGMVLCYASRALRNDPFIVMTAIYQNPEALRYATDRIKDDLEIVLKAVAKKPDVLRFASARVQGLIQVRRESPAVPFSSPLSGRVRHGTLSDE